MRRILILALALAWASAAEAQPRPAPDRICVPVALLDRLVTTVAAEPWSAAAPAMDAVREFGRTPPTPCPPPAPPADKDKP